MVWLRLGSRFLSGRFDYFGVFRFLGLTLGSIRETPSEACFWLS